jgi:hypothetical protein
VHHNRGARPTFPAGLQRRLGRCQKPLSGNIPDVNSPPAQVPYHNVAGKDVVGDKKNRSHSGFPQVFDDPVQNGLTQQVEHDRGHAKKRRDRARKTVRH